MSTVTLDTAKSFLDVIGSADDTKVQLLLDAAEDEAVQFMGVTSLDDLVDSNGSLPGSVDIGILLMLQSNYQATPEEQKSLRDVAEIKLFPYRIGLGI